MNVVFAWISVIAFSVVFVTSLAAVFKTKEMVWLIDGLVAFLLVIIYLLEAFRLFSSGVIAIVFLFGFAVLNIIMVQQGAYKRLKAIEEEARGAKK